MFSTVLLMDEQLNAQHQSGIWKTSPKASFNKLQVSVGINLA
jgi:hypothetical protein